MTCEEFAALIDRARLDMLGSELDAACKHYRACPSCRQQCHERTKDMSSHEEALARPIMDHYKDTWKHYVTNDPEA